MAKKETKRKADSLPPEPMRTVMAEAEELNGAVLCERFDILVNDLLRKSCAGKQFELKSGNCKEGCQTIEEPKIVPCLRLRWGDGPQDHLETDDTEVLCITVCNPYTNVVLKDFTLHLVVTTASGGAVPNQPDGTPSVMIKPGFMICFDDIPACDPQKPDASCISREVVMINRGAIAGHYKVFILYCFDACFTKLGIDPAAFDLELVAS